MKKSSTSSFVSAQHILFEDNHLLVINKPAGVLVQGDQTGDDSLLEYYKAYLKEKYTKPGNVYLGLPHRLDRPTSGVVILCKTSKSLTRMNKLFANDGVEKKYWAVLESCPNPQEGRLENALLKNARQNKSYIVDRHRKGAKQARLTYRVIRESDRFYLVEVGLETGRHHQIRAQFAHIGCPIKGDLKYGSKRGGNQIYLHARSVFFQHPTTKKAVNIVAPPPSDSIWNIFST